jgi:hypothetical protein
MAVFHLGFSCIQKAFNLPEFFQLLFNISIWFTGRKLHFTKQVIPPVDRLSHTQVVVFYKYTCMGRNRIVNDIDAIREDLRYLSAAGVLNTKTAGIKNQVKVRNEAY